MGSAGPGIPLVVSARILLELLPGDHISGFPSTRLLPDGRVSTIQSSARRDGGVVEGEAVVPLATAG